MIILIDLDDVLADFEGGFLERWRQRHPSYPCITRDQRTVFGMHKQYPSWCRDPIQELIREPGFFLGLPPIAGGQAAVREMLTHGHRVFFCTAPMPGCPTCATEKFQWVGQNLGPDLVGRIILTGDKTLVRGDILIDDNPAITGALPPVWEHVIFDVPYNRTVADKRRLVRWDDWRSIIGC
ncbi:MAG: 5'-3'-deoxyribonucleotidase [Patescibacteria group bacterium]|jgi:5'-nucleotidase